MTRSHASGGAAVVRIDKNYVLDAPQGRRTLAELFEGRRQLPVQHFMLTPGWEQGCPSCSLMADHSDGMTVHLAHRDVTLAAVSRAPLAEIERFRQRMSWRFKWVSSHVSDFNYAFGVSFTPQDGVDCKLARQMRLGAHSERRYLFMPYMDPRDLAIAADGIGKTIKAVANYAVDPLHADCG